MSEVIEFTPDRAASLRKAYEKAVAEGLEQFVWQGHEFVTDYAKYLLEYLKGRMG